MVAINDLDGLIGLVQAGALEIHPWGSTLANWEKPDRIVMDLDPGEGVAWPAVIAAAREVKQRLEAAGLVTFLKWSCHAFMPPQVLVQATLRSKATGLFQPRAE